MILRPESLLPQGPTPRTREMVADAWATCRRALKAALVDPAVHTVVVMVGTPGSGKTTWSDAHDAEGVVVFDAVWAHPGRRAAMARQIRAASRRAVAVWVRTPLPEALARNAARPVWRRVPQSFCLRAAAALHAQPPHVREGWNEVQVVDGSGG
jgi:predicted kinase